MKSRELDQFYTNPKIASYCFDVISEKIKLEDYFLIEPSAGTGSFSDLFHENSVALDLDPKKDYILAKNFFDFIPITSHNITIGNPPFGKNSSLAIKFFNKAASFSEYICFILPRTFKKDSVYNKLDLNFHLIYSEDLPKNSFIFNDKSYDVPSVFQIYKKGSLREKTFQKKDSSYFQFISKDKADIAIRRIGGLAGKVILDFSKYKEPSHYYLKINKEYINIMEDCFEEFNKKAFDSAGNPSLSKHELISIFEKKLIRD